MSEHSRAPAQTEAVGARIASDLGAGDVVVVRGELGAGKTTLIRGACRELGVTEPVTSPTFTIGHRYRGRLSVSHVDLYRLRDPELEEPGLLDDYLQPDTVAFVEWPLEEAGPLAGLASVELTPTIEVELRHAGHDEREISIQGRGGD